MNRRTSTETPTPHPQLAAALSCMELQLETELARYRQQRRESEASNPTAQRQPTTFPNRAAALESLLPETQNPAEVALPPQIAPPPTETAADAPAGEREFLPPPPEPQIDPAQTTAPDDYLESSEQLLRSLDPEPEAEPAAPPAPPAPRTPNLADRLLTPLGVISMLLLLVSGTLIAAALVDPALISKITGDRVKTTPTPVAKTPAPETEETAPKLSTDEFVDLELENLSTVEASPKVANSPKPANTPAKVPPLPPAATDAPKNSSSLTGTLIPSATPSPSPSPTAQPQAPVNLDPAPAPSSGDRFYYVTVNYGGQASLQQAQGTVPDAYLRQFSGETRIQMGAFLSQSQADNLAKQLQAQGYTASVYHR